MNKCKWILTETWKWFTLIWRTLEPADLDLLTSQRAGTKETSLTVNTEESQRYTFTVCLMGSSSCGVASVLMRHYTESAARKHLTCFWPFCWFCRLVAGCSVYVHCLLDSLFHCTVVQVALLLKWTHLLILHWVSVLTHVCRRVQT